MRDKVMIGTLLSVVSVMLWCCIPMGVFGATAGWLTNQQCIQNNPGKSCVQCDGLWYPSDAGMGCAWVRINAGPMRPGSSIKFSLFRMGENQLSEAIYTPQSLSFVAGYAMKGVSHEVTVAGAPRQVTMVQSSGIPFAVNFKDGESIGVPVFGDRWAMKLRLFMVDANGWSTLKDPAYYDLYTGDGERYRFNAFKTSSQYMQLVSHRTVAGREETYQDMGVEVIRDTSQNLRQVLLPSRLADIVVTDGSHYAVKFYTLAGLEGGKDTNGCYRIAANAVPFEIWSFANPAPGTLRKLLVTRTMGARTTVYDYTYEAAADTWTMVTGDGNSVARKEEEETRWNDARTERLIASTIKAADGNVVSRSLERVKTFSWGDGVTVRVTDPGGANLTNTFAYNAAGLTETAVEPDGSWRWYGYDTARRVTTELSAFKDSALTSDANAAHAVLTSYSPVDTNDSPRLNDQLPRTVTESIMGKVVSKTYRAYRQGNNGELQEIVEKTVSPTAAYGDASNLRTATTYYGTNTVNHQIGRIKTVAYPDGRMDSYTYDYGAYQPGVGEIPPSFEVNALSNYWCETIIHGNTNNPEGLAGKTTKETRILDPMSQMVLSETWVCFGGPNYDRVAWISKAYDEWQHPVFVKKSNGEKTEASWGGNCCGKEWEIGPDGTELNYGYDLLGQMISMTKKGATTNEADLVTNYTYDSEGRRLTETRVAGTLTLLGSANTFDLAGRLISTTNGQGIVTTYGYNGTTRTVIQGGLTNASVNYLDGQSKTTIENSIVRSASDYGVNSDGTRWTKSFAGPQGMTSPSWQKTTTDLLGRSILAEKPGYGGTVLTNAFAYNSKGQLIQTTSSQQSTTLYEYDDMGQQTRSGLDINNNGVLDLAGPDRVTASASWFDQDDVGNYWQCRTSILYAGNNSATPTTNSIQKTRLTGFSEISNLRSEIATADLLGNQTTSRTYINRPAKIVTQVVTYPDSTNSATQVTVNGLLATSTSKTGVQTTYTFDALGRQNAALQGGSGALRTVGSYTVYNAKGQVASTMDSASNTTTYTYDTLGRRIAVTDALSSTTYTAYDPEGRVLATWGATYPVAYDYDSYGRMTAMYTYRGSNFLSSYSEICNQKSQMDQTRWLYDETTGLLTNKTYADGHGPRYTYTPDGKLRTRTWARGIVTTYNYDSLNLLTNISYSDNTPAVTFTFDRLGRQTTITDGTGFRTFTYNDALQLAAETNTQGILQYSFDNLGRPSGFSTGRANPPGEPSYSVNYSYDQVGRFIVVSNNVGGALRAATYSYIPGSDLIAGYVNSDGFAVTRSYEPNRNLITSITNSFGGISLHRFDYENDQIGRRTKRADVDISTVISNLFAYNTRSELTDAVMGTNQYNYAYDPIGNRRSVTNNAEAWNYVANALNQYSQLTNNQSPITPTYDLDGNMTGYRDWTFVWDAENRLVLAFNATTVVSNVYDYMSRRVAKTVNGQTIAYVYQGWAMITESDTTSTNSYVYGLDLSGTSQGAGTIGGILNVNFSGTTAFYAYDANGNVTDLVGTNGAFAAQYVYDPYGNTIAKSGTLADVNPFRFSTKYLDAETGLYYYGYRYYMPEMGRWMGRDPIGLLAVANLYDFVKQNPITRVDPLGLWDFIVHRNWTAYWAGQNGYSMQSKTGVSEADEAVDGFWGGTGPLPGVGDQSYHFNTAGAGGGDSRITHSNTDLDAAKAACNWANSKDDYEEARKMLGRSLHAMQDWVAHGDFNSGGSSFYQHNTGGPVSADASPGRSPDDYPDDVALDAKGSPDGRVTSSFIDANDHAVFVGGHKRINLTADKSRPILQALIQFVQSNARPLPCGKCRKYFLSEDAP